MGKTIPDLFVYLYSTIIMKESVKNMKTGKYKFLTTIDHITTFAIAGSIITTLVLIVQMIKKDIKVDLFSITGIVLGFLIIAYSAIYLNYSLGIDIADLYIKFYECKVNGIITYDELISKSKDKFDFVKNNKWKLRHKTEGFAVYDEARSDNDKDNPPFFIRDNGLFQYNFTSHRSNLIFKQEGGIVIIDKEVYLIDPLTYIKFLYYKKKTKVLRLAEGK